MPIFLEDNLVKVGGTVLPGLRKSLEITREAAIDEVEVEGAAVKPKQAVGYEDAKIKIELIVDDVGKRTAIDKIGQINSLFQKQGQGLPQPVEMVCKETASAGIGKVLFEKLSYKATNKTNQYAVTLEFCQYNPPTVTVAVGGAAKAAPAPAPVLSAGYQDYLNGDRGAAPHLGDKTAASPATDNRSPVSCGSYRERMLYG